MDSIFDSNSKLDGKYFDSKGNNKPFNYQKQGIRGEKNIMALMDGLVMVYQ